MRKIAYAVSLGCEEYPLEVLCRVSAYIEDFKAISVRERTAINIVQPFFKKGMVELVPDPTILLDADYYLQFVDIKPNNNGCFIYVLQEGQKLIAQIEKLLGTEYEIYKPDESKMHPYSIEEWLSAIYNNRLVITNSYHGMLFSLIFHKDFYIIPIEGSLAGMNDRIYTVLEFFDLTDRIVNDYESFLRNENKQIEWQVVETRMKEFKKIGTSFLLKNLKK